MCKSGRAPLLLLLGEEAHSHHRGAGRVQQNMSKALIAGINQVATEKGLDREIIFEAIEASLVSAYKRNYGSMANVGAEVDRVTGEMRVLTEREVVDEVINLRTEITEADARRFVPTARWATWSGCPTRRTTSGVLPRRRPSRSSCSASARQNAIRSLRTSPTRSARSSRHRCAASMPCQAPSRSCWTTSTNA